MNFCRRCGSPLKHLENHVYKCANDHIIFANSSPTVGIFFVTHDNQILLSERGIEPHKGMLDSFGGFVDGEETLEHAAIRELEEELSLTANDYEPLQYLTSSVGHYPYKNEVLPALTTFYWSRLKSNQIPNPSDDVAAVHSVPLEEVDFSQLHDNDIKDGVRALQTLLSVKSL